MDRILMAKTILISTFQMDSKYFESIDDDIVKLAIRSYKSRDVYSVFDKIVERQTRERELLYIRNLAANFINGLNSKDKNRLNILSKKVLNDYFAKRTKFIRNDYRRLTIVFNKFEHLLTMCCYTDEELSYIITHNDVMSSNYTYFKNSAIKSANNRYNKLKSLEEKNDRKPTEQRNDTGDLQNNET